MVKDFKEKEITVSFKRAFTKPETKRARAALFILKNAVTKETRAKNIKISNATNNFLWERGLFKSHRKVTVKVVKEEDGVRVYLPTEKIIVKEEKKKKTKLDEMKEKAESMTKKSPTPAKETKTTEKKETKTPEKK